MLSSKGYRGGRRITPDEPDRSFGDRLAVGWRAGARIRYPLVVSGRWASNNRGAVWQANQVGMKVQRKMRGLSEGDHLGKVVKSVSDLDGDGLEDIAVVSAATSNRNADKIDIVSGRTWELLHSIDCIDESPIVVTDLDEVGDVNGDGVRELAVTGWLPSRGTGLLLLVVDIRNGRSVYSVPCLRGEDTGLQHQSVTQAVAHISDVDGDSIEDVIVGTSGWDQGECVLVSGATGKILQLHSLESDKGGENYYKTVLGMADLNGDRTPDYIVGSPSEWGKMATRGIIQAFSGASGAELWRREGELDQFLGFSMCAISDVDGDGVADVVIGGGCPTGERPFSKGVVTILSGRSGRVLLGLSLEVAEKGSR